MSTDEVLYILKQDPKVYFSTERTFLHWMHVVNILSLFSGLLLQQQNPVAGTSGYTEQLESAEAQATAIGTMNHDNGVINTAFRSTASSTAGSGLQADVLAYTSSDPQATSVSSLAPSTSSSGIIPSYGVLHDTPLVNHHILRHGWLPSIPPNGYGSADWTYGITQSNWIDEEAPKDGIAADDTTSIDGAVDDYDGNTDATSLASYQDSNGITSPNSLENGIFDLSRGKHLSDGFILHAVAVTASNLGYVFAFIALLFSGVFYSNFLKRMKGLEEGTSSDGTMFRETCPVRSFTHLMSFSMLMILTVLSIHVYQAFAGLPS